ncbi:DcrB-related protein [Polyangium aurulentum]|uniref:DcrB-related protein n=1 Tax=Polyangium aurulentum TaxID=2567896 RepID=UPI00146F352F|nr:DcrB-related protein [Polyangium aurulentum]UQA59898.1 DcrB-related protein [Polyangium aurulentum]
MGSFYMNEAMFDLPEAGFIDRTVTYLVGSSPGGNGVLLLVERRPLPVDTSLRQVVDALGKDAMTRFLGYRVLFEREIEVASQPALDVGARWRADSGEIVYVRRTHLALGETWLIITGEAPIIEREFCDAYIDHVLASLQLRA